MIIIVFIVVVVLVIITTTITIISWLETSQTGTTIDPPPKSNPSTHSQAVPRGNVLVEDLLGVQKGQSSGDLQGHVSQLLGTQNLRVKKD